MSRMKQQWKQTEECKECAAFSFHGSNLLKAWKTCEVCGTSVVTHKNHQPSKIDPEMGLLAHLENSSHEHYDHGGSTKGVARTLSELLRVYTVRTVRESSRVEKHCLVIPNRCSCKTSAAAKS